MPRQLELADRLRAAGLTVVEVDGWQGRGSEVFAPHGVVCHHTADGASGEIPSLRVLINGRADLPGPLCQVGLARSGACYVIAAGRANHAGKGGWRGLAGNSSVWGIEAENNGSQPWPSVQLDAYHRLAAALITYTPTRDVRLVCAHKEWAPGRKPDPHSIDMDEFRRRVTAVLKGEDDMRLSDEDIRKVGDYVFEKVSKDLHGAFDWMIHFIHGPDRARLDELLRRTEP